MTERLGDTELWKTIQKHKEQDKQVEEQKRKMIEEGDIEDPLRNFDNYTKEWVKRFLSLSGVIRNEFQQLTDIYPRPSERQIRGMLKELLNIDISERKIRQYKRFLIERNELLSDKEFKEQQPTREELRQIKKTGCRAMAIQRSKEVKSHLSSQELEQFLERQKKEKKPEKDKDSRMKELRRKIDDEGYCPTCEEEEQLEDYLQER
jgi:hypothetical protein